MNASVSGAGTAALAREHMTLDVDSLRAEIAKRHNVLLGKDDPILATITLNELVLEHFYGRAQLAAQEAERKGAGLMAQHLATVKSSAEKMIGGAATYFNDEVRKTAEQMQARLLAGLDGKIQAAERAARAAESVKWPVMVAAAAAIAACFLTMGLLLGGFIRH